MGGCKGRRGVPGGPVSRRRRIVIPRGRCYVAVALPGVGEPCLARGESFPGGLAPSVFFRKVAP